MKLDAQQETDLIRRVTETHTVVHEKVVPWLEEVNGTTGAIKERQDKLDGALGMLRWIIITGIAVAGLVGGYIFTQANDPIPIQIDVVPGIEIQKGGETDVQ